MKFLLSLFAALIVAAASVATAAACTTGRANDPHGYFAGGSSLGGGACVNGIDGYEYITNPTTVNNQGSSSAWMGLLYKNMSTNETVLGQMGFANDTVNSVTTRYLWWEVVAFDASGHVISGSDTGVQHFASNPTIGSFPEFTVTYDHSQFHFKENGTLIATHTYTGQGLSDSSCQQATAESEIHNYDEQSPGTSGNKEQWLNLGDRHSATWDYSSGQVWSNYDTYGGNLVLPATVTGGLTCEICGSPATAGLDANVGDLSQADDPIVNSWDQASGQSIYAWDTCIPDPPDNP